MAQSALTRPERRRSLFAVIASMTVVSLMYGMSVPLLALVLEQHGVGSLMIGINTAVQPLATFAIAPIAPRIIRALGPAHTMIYATFGSAALFLLLGAFPNVWVWFPLRFLLGAFGCFLWIIGEAWVNQISSGETRGRMVGLYVAAGAGGTALGPLVLSQIGSQGMTPFLTAAMLVVVAGLPIMAATRIAPRLDGQASARLLAFLMLAPIAMLLNLVHGAAIEIFLAFLPIYGERIGIGANAGLHLQTAALLGGIALQVPIGWLADRMDRRLLLSISVAFIIVAVAAMPLLLPVDYWNVGFMFIYGGVFNFLYALGIILLGDRFKGMDLIFAGTVFNVMWSLGGVAGPPLGGLGMELWDPNGLIAVLALMWLLYLPVPVIGYLRGRRRMGVPE
jgi:MFS family permease